MCVCVCVCVYIHTHIYIYKAMARGVTAGRWRKRPQLIVRGYRHDVEYALRYYWATEKTPAAKKIMRGCIYPHVCVCVCVRVCVRIYMHTCLNIDRMHI